MINKGYIRKGVDTSRVPSKLIDNVQIFDELNITVNTLTGTRTVGGTHLSHEKSMSKAAGKLPFYSKGVL